MFEGVPGVSGYVCEGAFGLEPGVEGRLGHGEDFFVGHVGAGAREKRECVECLGQQADVGAGTFLVCFGEGEPDIFVGEEEVGPGEVQDFFWADEREEAGDEEDIVVQLEGTKSVEERVEVLEGEPLGGALVAVRFAVRAQAEGREGVEGGWEIVEAAPHFDGGRCAVYFSIGEVGGEAGEDKGVDGVWGEGSEASLAAEGYVPAEEGGVLVVRGVRDGSLREL